MAPLRHQPQKGVRHFKHPRAMCCRSSIWLRPLEKIEIFPVVIDSLESQQGKIRHIKQMEALGVGPKGPFLGGPRAPWPQPNPPEARPPGAQTTVGREGCSTSGSRGSADGFSFSMAKSCYGSVPKDPNGAVSREPEGIQKKIGGRVGA